MVVPVAAVMMMVCMLRHLLRTGSRLAARKLARARLGARLHLAGQRAAADALTVPVVVVVMVMVRVVVVSAVGPRVAQPLLVGAIDGGSTVAVLVLVVQRVAATLWLVLGRWLFVVVLCGRNLTSCLASSGSR